STSPNLQHVGNIGYHGPSLPPHRPYSVNTQHGPISPHNLSTSQTAVPVSPNFNHPFQHYSNPTLAHTNITQVNPPPPSLLLPFNPAPARPAHVQAWLTFLRTLHLTPPDIEYLTGFLVRTLTPLPIFDEDVINTYSHTPEISDTELIFNTSLKPPSRRIMGGGENRGVTGR